MNDRIYRVLCWIALILTLPLLKMGASVFLPLAIAIIAFHPFLPWFLDLLPDKGKKSIWATFAVSGTLLAIVSAVFGALAAGAAYGMSQESELLTQIKSSYDSAIGSERVGALISRGESLASQLIPILPGLALFVFVAWEYPPLRLLFQERFGREGRSEALVEFEQEGRVLRRFWGARTLGGFLTGLAVALALWSLNFPLAWLWGAINFLLNYIPTVGSFVGILFPVGFALAIDTGVPPLYVAMAAGGLQLLFGTFVDPLIQDRFLPLSSLTVFFSIMFWGWVWGPWGALIGVPLTFSLAKLSMFHPVYNVFGRTVLQDLEAS